MQSSQGVLPGSSFHLSVSILSGSNELMLFGQSQVNVIPVRWMHVFCCAQLEDDFSLPIVGLSVRSLYACE